MPVPRRRTPTGAQLSPLVLPARVHVSVDITARTTAMALTRRIRSRRALEPQGIGDVRGFVATAVAGDRDTPGQRAPDLLDVVGRNSSSRAGWPRPRQWADR